jgi:hypothetical protein
MTQRWLVKSGNLDQFACGPDLKSACIAAVKQDRAEAQRNGEKPSSLGAIMSAVPVAEGVDEWFILTEYVTGEIDK